MNSQSELPFTHHLWLGDERSGFCGRTNENSYVPFIVQALVGRSIRWLRKVEYDLPFSFVPHGNRCQRLSFSVSSASMRV